MHETDADLRALQKVLDESYATAGEHLRSIFDHTPRVPAAELVELLPGMQVIDLATVTPRGEPRVAPVDGLFFRGRWHFGTSPTAFRTRHLAANPAASAAHTRGEGLCVLTHGRVEPIDLRDPSAAGFLAHVRDIYPTFDEWASVDSPYWALEPARVYVRRPIA
jgi:Pyridoxamine 5'-phosphate oxidase